MTRPTGRSARRSAKICPHSAWVSSSAKPQSTIVQLGPSSSSHRLMWLSAKGSGIRSHRTPGAIGMTSPGAGGVFTGKSNKSAISSGITN
jgi:hypothetical protein